MKEIIVEIKNKAGLHARPASLFVQVAAEFESEIIVKCGEDEINGKSIMGLMLLAAEQGKKIVLEADGEDEDELLEALRELVEEKKFNEE